MCYLWPKMNVFLIKQKCTLSTKRFQQSKPIETRNVSFRTKNCNFRPKTFKNFESILEMFQFRRKTAIFDRKRPKITFSWLQHFPEYCVLFLLLLPVWYLLKTSKLFSIFEFVNFHSPDLTNCSLMISSLKIFHHIFFLFLVTWWSSQMVGRLGLIPDSFMYRGPLTTGTRTLSRRL